MSRRLKNKKERFDISEDFSISDFADVPFCIFHEKPISAKVVFDKELSDYIQRRTGYPSQKIKQLKDGGILLFMTPSRREEIKSTDFEFRNKGQGGFT